MGVDLLAKYVPEDSKDSLDPANSGPCFRIGNKPARYVFFRELDGKFAAFGYFILQSLHYDPDPKVGLVLQFGKTTVTLSGKNLMYVARSFMDHRVRECLVGDERQGAPPRAPFVARILINLE